MESRGTTTLKSGEQSSETRNKSMAYQLVSQQIYSILKSHLLLRKSALEWDFFKENVPNNINSDKFLILGSSNF